jgi:integrase
MAAITKREGTYRIKVSCGYDAMGKQIIKSMTYKPKPSMTEKQIEKEVNRQAVLFEEEVKKGYHLTSLKLETFMEQWFIDYVDLKLKKTTITNYNRHKKRVYKHLGHLRIDKISPIDIQKFVSIMVSEELSANTIKNHVRLVSNVLNYAVKKRLLTYNPCVTVDYPKESKKQRNIFSLEEAKQFLTLLEEQDYENDMPFIAFFTLLVYTGARKSELLGLEWEDIDFRNQTISINKGYHYSSWHKETYIDTTKTKSSERMIKISDVPIKALEKLVKWQNEQKEICGNTWQETNRLFTDRIGKSLSPITPNYWLNKFCKKTDMKNVNVHSFRHFTASTLINQGVDIVSVQAVLGHSSPDITLNIYSHAFKNAKSKAAQAVVNALE